MKIIACTTAVLLAASTSASAAGFIDLDFDAVHVPEFFGYLPWDQAAPGWSHPDGDSTSYVSSIPNVGYSQSYWLLPSPFGAAAGPYAFGMKSGDYYEGYPERGPWVDAFISQTGQLGPGVRSVSLLSTNPHFELTLDGTPIDMQPVGLDPSSPTYEEDVQVYSGEWSGDVTAFAGKSVELKIIDLETTPESPTLVVDEIQFLPVPEPDMAASFGLGLLGTLLALRRRAAGAAGPRTMSSV